MPEAAHTIQVDIVSAEGEIFSGTAKMVFAVPEKISPSALTMST